MKKILLSITASILYFAAITAQETEVVLPKQYIYLDSLITKNTYKSLSGNMHFSIKRAYTYGPEDYSRREFTYHYDTTNKVWVFQTGQKRIYNEAGSLLENIEYYMNGESETIEAGARTIYKHEKSDNFLTTTLYYSENSDLKKGGKDELKLNDNGDALETVRYAWDEENSLWYAYSKTASTYDSLYNRLTYYYSTKLPETKWDTTYGLKNVYTYDDFGNKIEEIEYGYDEIAKEWVNGTKYERTFDTKGNVIEDIRSNWIASKSQFMGYQKRVYTYNDEGQVRYSEFYGKVDGIEDWVLQSNTRSTYSGESHITDTSYSFNPSGDTTSKSFSINDYDEDGNKIYAEIRSKTNYEDNWDTTITYQYYRVYIKELTVKDGKTISARFSAPLQSIENYEEYISLHSESDITIQNVTKDPDDDRILLFELNRLPSEGDTIEISSDFGIKASYDRTVQFSFKIGTSEESPTAINETETKESSVYPTVSSKNITVDCPAGLISVDLYNSMGQMLRSYSYGGEHSANIDLSLQPGIYFVMVNNAESFQILIR